MVQKVRFDQSAGPEPSESESKSESQFWVSRWRPSSLSWRPNWSRFSRSGPSSSGVGQGQSQSESGSRSWLPSRSWFPSGSLSQSWKHSGSRSRSWIEETVSRIRNSIHGHRSNSAIPTTSTPSSVSPNQPVGYDPSLRPSLSQDRPIQIINNNFHLHFDGRSNDVQDSSVPSPFVQNDNSLISISNALSGVISRSSMTNTNNNGLSGIFATVPKVERWEDKVAPSEVRTMTIPHDTGHLSVALNPSRWEAVYMNPGDRSSGVRRWDYIPATTDDKSSEPSVGQVTSVSTGAPRSILKKRGWSQPNRSVGVNSTGGSRSQLGLYTGSNITRSNDIVSQVSREVSDILGEALSRSGISQALTGDSSSNGKSNIIVTFKYIHEPSDGYRDRPTDLFGKAELASGLWGSAI